LRILRPGVQKKETPALQRRSLALGAVVDDGAVLAKARNGREAGPAVVAALTAPVVERASRARFGQRPRGEQTVQRRQELDQRGAVLAVRLSYLSQLSRRLFGLQRGQRVAVGPRHAGSVQGTDQLRVGAVGADEDPARQG